MIATSQAQEKSLRVQIKNGVLDLSIKFIDFNGSMRPFIVRTLKLGSSQQRTKTEQHTLIQSAAELDEWIAQDGFSAHHPQAFEQLKQFCKSVLA